MEDVILRLHRIAARLDTPQSGRRQLLAYYQKNRFASPEHREAFRIIAEDMEEGVPEAVAQVEHTSIRKVMQLFKLPKIVSALKGLLGKLSIKNIIAFLKHGKDWAKKWFSELVGSSIVFIQKHDIPTLTDLIKRTETGAKAIGAFEDKIDKTAWAHELDAALRKHARPLAHLATAAIFAWIWFNVDEISWKPEDLIAGFTGHMSLPMLLKTLPESGIGLITGNLLGIGYTIMPWMLGARIMWMIGKKMLVYHNGKIGLNPAFIKAVEATGVRI